MNGKSGAGRKRGKGDTEHISLLALRLSLSYLYLRLSGNPATTDDDVRGSISAGAKEHEINN